MSHRKLNWDLLAGKRPREGAADPSAPLKRQDVGVKLSSKPETKHGKEDEDKEETVGVQSGDVAKNKPVGNEGK